MPTVKVSDHLHARLRDLADSEHTTIGGIIGRSLDVLEESAFWAAVRREMAPRAVAAGVDAYTDSLKDGLESDETWANIL
jgi:predicted transcriptional regulator